MHETGLRWRCSAGAPSRQRQRHAAAAAFYVADQRDLALVGLWCGGVGEGQLDVGSLRAAAFSWAAATIVVLRQALRGRLGGGAVTGVDAGAVAAAQREGSPISPSSSPSGSDRGSVRAAA